MSIEIVIPTAGRHDRLRVLLDSVRQTTPLGRYRVTLVHDGYDTETPKLVATALSGLDVRCLEVTGSFPAKANAGVAASETERVLICGNDVRFHFGWYGEAERGAGVGVLGTNDLSPRTEAGTHATAQVVAKSYIVDPGGSYGEPGHVFHEGYHHNYADQELCRLAQYRGEWSFAKGCVIEHLHPVWGGAKWDAVYRKGERYYEDDKALYRQRRRMWIA